MPEAAQIQELLPPASEIVAYNDFRSQLAKLKEENAKTIFNYEDAKGDKEARSYVHNLRKTKAAVDKKRLELGRESREFQKKVNDEGNTIIEEVEAMIQVHQKEIDAVELRAVRRKADLQQKVEGLGLTRMATMPGGRPQTSEELTDILERIRSQVIDDSYGDFKDEALKKQQESIGTLESAIVNAQKREKDAAELERLRKEKEQRDEADRKAAAEKEQQDRDERIRKDAEEKTRKNAEEKAEQEKKEAERKTQEAIEAEKRKAKDAQDAADRKAEEDRQAAEREKQTLREAAEKAQREAAEAVDAERRRVQQEETDKKAADAKRAADEAHQTAIHGNIIAALDRIGLGNNHATALIEAIRAGQIPHITINY